MNKENKNNLNFKIINNIEFQRGKSSSNYMIALKFYSLIYWYIF